MNSLYSMCGYLIVYALSDHGRKTLFTEPPRQISENPLAVYGGLPW